VIWPFNSPDTNAILERAAEPIWKVEPPQDWPDPPPMEVTSMSDTRSVALDRMSKAFNEWMRRYTETPEQFAREFQAVSKFLAETNDGKEPSYGECCSKYFAQLLDELPITA